MSEELLIMHHRIDLADCPVLYERPMSPEAFEEDWLVRSGEWSCEGDSLLGRNERPAPGCVECRKAFPGDVLVDFHAQTVLPCTHDIDVMWNMRWDESKDARGTAYVAGIQGWWDGKVGIEKAPEYKQIAAAPCPWFTPGRVYHVQAGSVGGECFVFVDGELRLEMLDPDPIDSTTSDRIGFEAYQSMFRIRRVVVRQIVSTPRKQEYAKEF